MRAGHEDRLENDTGRRKFPTGHVLLVLAIIAVAYVLWQTLREQAGEPPPEPVAVEEVVPEPPPLPPAEDIPKRPEPVLTEPEAEPVEQPPPLPSLADSDPLVREQLDAAGVGPTLESIERQQNLVQQAAALVDGFSRGVVLRKLLPLAPPTGDFSVKVEGDRTYMDPAGYARYDDYAEAIAALNTDVLVNGFHTLRPLYEEAYGQLGLNPEDFDNAVVRTLDRIIATPEIDTAIPLTRKSVMYKYADPQLEQLAPIQKQLLRMGPENIRRIKEQARALRAGLLNAQKPAG